MRVIVIACPGQGSQTPGFLAPWLELDGVAEQLAAFSDAAEVDLVKHGTTSDADTIRDTSIAQPLIVAASIIANQQLLRRSSQPAGGYAGHSVGEVAALVATGVLSPEDGMTLVGIRGRAMAESAAEADSGMAAVLGGVESEVIAYLRELDLSPANFNGAGQIVAAGSEDAIDALAVSPLRGTRVIPLEVAGAFHTIYMTSAEETLKDAVKQFSPHDPNVTLWTNLDGSIVSDGDRALKLLVGQVASPVRWDLCMRAFIDAGISGFVELSPAGALTGLARRGLPGVPQVAVKTPDDLDAAVAVLDGASA